MRALRSPGEILCSILRIFRQCTFVEVQQLEGYEASQMGQNTTLILVCMDVDNCTAI